MEEKNLEKQVIYTNSIGIEASIFDIKLDLKYLSTDDNDKKTTKDLCEVVMSPQHAKAFSNVLKNTIEAYEKQFGEIELKPKQREGK